MDVNIAICDDEKTEIDYLTLKLKKWAKSRKLSIALSDFRNAESLLFHYADNKNIDILLLDIQMDKISGVDLAKLIRKENDTIQIIFVTGFSDFISEGYDVSALHYLMKPVNEDKLFTTLDKAVKNLIKTDKVIFLPIEGEIVRVIEGSIMYIESFSHFLEITTATGKYTIKIPFYELEQQLSEDFIRCHRSYIVGLKHISKITKTDVIIEGGKAIPLSRRSYNEVNKALMNYFKGVR